MGKRLGGGWQNAKNIFNRIGNNANNGSLKHIQTGFLDKTFDNYDRNMAIWVASYDS